MTFSSLLVIQSSSLSISFNTACVAAPLLRVSSEPQADFSRGAMLFCISDFGVSSSLDFV